MKEILPKYVEYNRSKDRSGRKTTKIYRGRFVHKNTDYHCGSYETIKEAQIAVDKKRLQLGLEPVLLKKI